MFKWFPLILVGLSLKVSGWIVFAYLFSMASGFEHLSTSTSFALVLFFMTNCVIALCNWPLIPSGEA